MQLLIDAFILMSVWQMVVIFIGHLLHNHTPSYQKIDINDCAQLSSFALLVSSSVLVEINFNNITTWGYIDISYYDYRLLIKSSIYREFLYLNMFVRKPWYRYELSDAGGVNSDEIKNRNRVVQNELWVVRYQLCYDSFAVCCISLNTLF